MDPPPNADPMRKGDFPRVFASGLMSGTVGVTVSYPFNMIRCMQQVGHLPARGTLGSAMRYVMGTAGVRGLYRGFHASYALYTPATGVFYSAYFLFSQRLGDWSGNPAAATFAAGMLANAAAGLLWTPMDNIVQRVWLSQRTPSAVVRDLHSSGGLPAFWRAYATTLCVWAPLSGIFFLVYEAAMRYMSALPILRDLPELAVLPASAGAGALAVMATNPADVVRTRYQVRCAGLVLHRQWEGEESAVCGCRLW
jgi:hypothetical protein